jgi:hypothetical protein
MSQRWGRVDSTDRRDRVWIRGSGDHGLPYMGYGDYMPCPYLRLISSLLPSLVSLAFRSFIALRSRSIHHAN